MKSLLLSFAFFSFCTVVFAQNNKAAQTEVRKTVDALFDAMRKGDSTALRKVFHSSARLQTTFFNKEKKPMLVTDNIDNFVKSVGTPHPEIYDEKLLSYDVKVDDNLATVWTEYEFYVGTKFSHCGVNAFQLAKTETGWQIIQITDTRRKEGCKKK